MNFKEYGIALGNNVRQASDWTMTKTQFVQNVSQQSDWSQKPISTISNPTSQIKSTMPTNLMKEDAWGESKTIRSNEKKAFAFKWSYCKPILVGLIISLLIGGIALATVTTMWLKPDSAVNTTIETITSSTTSVTSITTSTTTSSTTSVTSITSKTTTTSASTTTSRTTTTSTTTTTSMTTTTSTSSATTTTSMTTTTSTSSATTTTSMTTATTSSTTTTTTTTTSATTTTSGQIIYSQSFINGATPTSQCTAWTSFIAQLTLSSYTLLTISGTLDPVGITATDPSVIAGIALALQTSSSYGPATSNGRSWVVDSCGPGPELSAGGTTCQCTSSDYIVRPCINNLNYGGINSTTCSGLSQTMTVIFQ